MSTLLFPEIVYTRIITLRRAIVVGPPFHAIMAFYVIACLTIVPLTWIRTGYSFSIGYGLSVATMSLILAYCFGVMENGKLLFLNTPSVLVIVALVYGLRLAAYIFLRNITVKEMQDMFKKVNTTPFFRSTVLALGLSLLYTFMVTPVLFALRFPLESSKNGVLNAVQVMFTVIAACGTILESISDQHKYEVKRRRKKKMVNKFVGPTTWCYKICRHPNYLGEILFWLGLFGAGSVSFGKSITAWLFGSLGFCAILVIMFGASNRLEQKQQKNYGNDPVYKNWKPNVKFALIPFLK